MEKYKDIYWKFSSAFITLALLTNCGQNIEAINSTLYQKSEALRASEQGLNLEKYLSQGLIKVEFPVVVDEKRMLKVCNGLIVGVGNVIDEYGRVNVAFQVPTHCLPDSIISGEASQLLTARIDGGEYFVRNWGIKGEERGFAAIVVSVGAELAEEYRTKIIQISQMQQVTATESGELYYLMGYYGDYSRTAMQKLGEPDVMRVSGIKSLVGFASCPSGYSGSPVWKYDDGSYKLVGQVFGTSPVDPEFCSISIFSEDYFNDLRQFLADNTR